MGWFGSQNLSTKFGIVLGSAIIIVLAAGMIKVWYNKRRLAKNIKIEELEKANSTQERLNVEELGEGDLFGVRAIQRGFFGGVSQSRSNSPAQSMFGPPSTTAVDLSEATRNLEAIRAPSTASSSSEDSQSRVSSEISVPKSTKHKPSPLRLQPSDAEIRRAAMHNRAGSYIPPPPIKEVQSKPDSLEVQFGTRAVSESPPIRTQSDEDISQLRYQGEVPRNLMFLAGQHSSVRSQAGSIYGSAESSPRNPPKIPKVPTPPAPTHVFGFPPRIPTRSRSSSPEESSSSDRSSSSSPELPVPSIPSPFRTSYQPSTLVEETKPETSRKRLSYQPTLPSEIQTEEPTSHQRESSAPTSTLTPRTSIFDNESTIRPPIPPRARPITGQISRTNDSIRISRKSSLQAQAQEHRYSRDRDLMHYDPTAVASSRNRSGSVQGRAVDFDRPRESPFGNSNAIASEKGSVKSQRSRGSWDSGSSVSTGSSGSEGVDWRAEGMGRNVAEDTIVEAAKPIMNRGRRTDASDLV
ncbi:55b3bad4-0013-47d6-a73d-63ddd622067a [Sclerotinia trifoliorum]|uniref:55b3bad4-0013-47d6-a73d-63ddd622067a n=1 Tax=Sclerotinia trifoliorum TaxID=28548 RepID=A0A8H2VTM8_9HELO|nr:55b3bad4-0013-47d6-a73d-63ddd622067a [Sclerotinia trifoliorum]